MDAQPAPQDQQGQPQGQADGDPMKAVKMIEQGLLAIQDGLSQANAPKEIMAPLQEAVDSYQEFVGAFTGNAAPSKGPGIQDAQTMGQSSARPADQPSGAKRMVPA